MLRIPLLRTHPTSRTGDADRPISICPVQVGSAVAGAAVIGVPDPKWKEGIKAVCQLKEGQSLEPKELIEFVGSRIARYKKPQYVEFITDFPLLEDGSPDREKIKELYGGEQ